MGSGAPCCLPRGLVRRAVKLRVREGGCKSNRRRLKNVTQRVRMGSVRRHAQTRAWTLQYSCRRSRLQPQTGVVRGSAGKFPPVRLSPRLHPVSGQHEGTRTVTFAYMRGPHDDIRLGLSISLVARSYVAARAAVIPRCLLLESAPKSCQKT